MSDTWTINDIEFACVGCGQKHVFKIKAENSPVLAAEKSRADALAERVKELEAGEPWKLNIEIAKRADALAEKVASSERIVAIVRGQHAGHRQRFLKVLGRTDAQFDCALCAALDSIGKDTGIPGADPTNRDSR